MNNYSPYISRRKLLSEVIKKDHAGKKGVILLLAGFEDERHAFRQESSFYYLTGLEEPGVALLIEPEGNSTLFVPQYGTPRSRWAQTIVDDSLLTIATESTLKPSHRDLEEWGISNVRLLGQACPGYTFSSACVTQEYEQLLATLERHVQQGDKIFTVYPEHSACGQVVVDRLLRSKSNLKAAIVDISASIALLRRTKSQMELELIYEAIDCTMQAHEAAAVRIEPDVYEFQIQAGIEFIFKESGGTTAFPSIVASGKNSTTLHYNRNDSLMKKGDLVIIDIGAQMNYYCADLTRTYPVSGEFTNRQRQIYELVLETQKYIAQIAAPGYYLNNQQDPQKSLQHLAIAFLKDRGYDRFFTHGIGHYLGLDVHDVGSYREPLKEGDVITIEPGIYIPEERLGVRIEDNYWITKTGAVCMSEELPSDSYEIEQLMAEELEEEE